jgi:hypothetical protein
MACHVQKRSTWRSMEPRPREREEGEVTPVLQRSLNAGRSRSRSRERGASPAHLNGGRSRSTSPRQQERRRSAAPSYRPPPNYHPRGDNPTSHRPRERSPRGESRGGHASGEPFSTSRWTGPSDGALAAAGVAAGNGGGSGTYHWCDRAVCSFLPAPIARLLTQTRHARQEDLL